MKRYFGYYLTAMKTALMAQFQYRAQNYFFMIGMIAEPVIYLVVWSSVANLNGGSVGGYTAGAFAAYYIVWTLVRCMNLVFTPYGWERRIQRGQLSGELLKPIHPIHGDVAYFAGWKFVIIVLWIPLAIVLSLIFKPELHPAWYQGVIFFFSIWAAFLIRTVFVSILGMITFWTTRVSAIFDLYFGLELILSGRLVPMTLMPAWVQHAANFLPFQWTFYCPINVLVGQSSLPELLTGLGIQVLWILGGTAVLNVVWHFGIRRFSSVGN
jgi:ABC-2 type transport system permease protein